MTSTEYGELLNALDGNALETPPIGIQSFIRSIKPKTGLTMSFQR